MRIVRFHLEPWQKGGSISTTPCSSPSLSTTILSPVLARRRQRKPDPDDKYAFTYHGYEDSSTKKDKVNSCKFKYRYPQTVKRLSRLCGDVLANFVK